MDSSPSVSLRLSSRFSSVSGCRVEEETLARWVGGSLWPALCTLTSVLSGLQVPGMPSLRARPEEAEMEPSVPGPSPWTPAARVSSVPTVTRPASALHAPLCCGDTEQGTAPRHPQQPGTGTKLSPGALILGELRPCHPAATPTNSLAVTLGVGCLVDWRCWGWGVREEADLVPSGPGALSVMLWFPCCAVYRGTA